MMKTEKKILPKILLLISLRKVNQYIIFRILFLDIYFYVCTKCDDCWWEHHFSDNYPLLSKGKKKIKSCEKRLCKSDLEPQDLNTDNFMSKRSDFDGYQIPSSWISKESQTPKQKLHPYHQKCLAILKNEIKKKRNMETSSKTHLIRTAIKMPVPKT